MLIRVLSDGKAGHLNQSMGLADALCARTGATKERLDVGGMTWKELRRALINAEQKQRCDLWIGTGHGTHKALLLAKLVSRAPRVVCMKPSLPKFLFDLCVVPRHDMGGRNVNKGRVITTIGAMNSIVPDPDAEKNIHLVLLGGPSRDFDWDGPDMLDQLSMLAQHLTDAPIVLTTSRRTPAGFAEAIADRAPEIRVIPVEDTKPGWVADHLRHARSVWVSRDSVSMVYEALGSGAPVGILRVPASHGGPSRITRGLDSLVQEGRATPIETWRSRNYVLTPPPHPIHEADRVAAYILQNLLPNQSNPA